MQNPPLLTLNPARSLVPPHPEGRPFRAARSAGRCVHLPSRLRDWGWGVVRQTLFLNDGFGDLSKVLILALAISFNMAVAL
jgi:hypothetical protein